MSRPLVTLVIADKALDVRGTAAEFQKEFGSLSGTALAEALEELIGVVYEHGRNDPKPSPTTCPGCGGPNDCVACFRCDQCGEIDNENGCGECYRCAKCCKCTGRVEAPAAVAKTATTVGTPIRVNGRDFTVTEIREGKGKDAGRPVYILSGKRGAKYATCRNVNHPEMMFLVSERGFGIPAGWERVWLTDASGALVAGGSL